MKEILPFSKTGIIFLKIIFLYVVCFFVGYFFIHSLSISNWIFTVLTIDWLVTSLLKKHLTKVPSAASNIGWGIFSIILFLILSVAPGFFILALI